MGRVVTLALDYGERRIGVAVSDALGIAAHGLPTIETGEEGEELDRIAEIAAGRDVRVIVVGLPLRMDGTEGTQARRVRGFIKELRRRLPGIRIETQDERLTSARAHRELSREGVGMRERAERVDRMAAQFILMQYLKRQQPQRADATDPSSQQNGGDSC